MRNFMIIAFFGVYSVKIRNKFLNFPKLAPWAVVGFLSLGMGLANNDVVLKIVGLPLTIITLFSFFYMALKPLTEEELDKYFPKN